MSIRNIFSSVLTEEQLKAVEEERRDIFTFDDLSREGIFSKLKKTSPKTIEEEEFNDVFKMLYEDENSPLNFLSEYIDKDSMLKMLTSVSEAEELSELNTETKEFFDKIEQYNNRVEYENLIKSILIPPPDYEYIDVNKDYSINILNQEFNTKK